MKRSRIVMPWLHRRIELILETICMAVLAWAGASLLIAFLDASNL